MRQKRKTFFSSDHHLFHTRIVNDMGRKQFSSIQEHNEYIIDRHNSVVSPNDVCKFLGDFILELQDLSLIEETIAKFNGVKHLILGNHDTPARIKEYVKFFDKVMAYDTAGYKDNRKADIIVSHVPVHPCNLTERFKYNVHGHLHEYFVPDDPRYMCVSLEQIDFTPISLEEVLEKFNNETNV